MPRGTGDETLCVSSNAEMRSSPIGKRRNISHVAFHESQGRGSRLAPYSLRLLGRYAGADALDYFMRCHFANAADDQDRCSQRRPLLAHPSSSLSLRTARQRARRRAPVTTRTTVASGSSAHRRSPLPSCRPSQSQCEQCPSSHHQKCAKTIPQAGVL